MQSKTKFPQILALLMRQQMKYPAQWPAFHAAIEIAEKHHAAERKEDKQVQRLMQVPGIGPIVSLPFVAYVGDGSRGE
jgi:hypothetical protein